MLTHLLFWKTQFSIRKNLKCEITIFSLTIHRAGEKQPLAHCGIWDKQSIAKCLILFYRQIHNVNKLHTLSKWPYSLSAKGSILI